MTLWLLSILLVLGLSYLTLVGRDNRFAGHQERNEQAWYMAQAGLAFFQEYYTVTDQGLKARPGVEQYAALGTDSASKDSSKRLMAEQSSARGTLRARVYFPAPGKHYYFDIIDCGTQGACIRGVVEGTWGASHCLERCLNVPVKGVSYAYDETLST